jgi:hypothetical protein
MNKPRQVVPGIKEQTEVALHVSNDLKVLAKLFASLATWSRDIDAWRFYSDHKRAAILLVTSNESKLLRAIRAAGFECDTNPVVVLEEHRRTVSAIRLSTELRANGGQILDAYTCFSPHNGTALVLKTTDAPKAAAVLDAMNLCQEDPLIDVSRSSARPEALEAA